jgi:hypothetical protein
MTPQDVSIFQWLAGLFTLSFIVMTILFLRFLQGIEESRNHLVNIAIRLEKGLDPILADLRAGAAQFRTAGERTRHSAEQLGELGDQLGRLTTFTRTGGLALLFSPQTGRKTRRQIGDLAEGMEEYTEDLAEQAEQGLKMARQKGRQWAGQAKDFVEDKKAQVAAAVDGAGR